MAENMQKDFKMQIDAMNFALSHFSEFAQFYGYTDLDKEILSDSSDELRKIYNELLEGVESK